jgi:hypothetical protein
MGDHQNIFSSLSLKTVKIATIYMHHFLAAAVARTVMFDLDAHMPRVNRGLVNVGACLIAGIRLARESYRDRIEDAPMAVACPTRPSDLGILGDISGTMTIYIMPNGHYISL